MKMNTIGVLNCQSTHLWDAMPEATYQLLYMPGTTRPPYPPELPTDITVLMKGSLYRFNISYGIKAVQQGISVVSRYNIQPLSRDLDHSKTIFLVINFKQK